MLFRSVTMRHPVSGSTAVSSRTAAQGMSASSSHEVIFLMDRMDMQRRGPVRVLEDTQPLVESIKNVMRGDRNRGCCLMRNLDRMTTTPETGFYTDYSGWSVSFKLGTE